MFICFIVTWRTVTLLQPFPTSAVSQQKSQWRRCRAPGGHRNLPKVGFWNLKQRRRERCYSGGVGPCPEWLKPCNNFNPSLMNTSIFWKMSKRIPAFFWGESLFFSRKTQTGYKFIEFSAAFLGEKNNWVLIFWERELSGSGELMLNSAWCLGYTISFLFKLIEEYMSHRGSPAHSKKTVYHVSGV